MQVIVLKNRNYANKKPYVAVRIARSSNHIGLLRIKFFSHFLLPLQVSHIVPSQAGCSAPHSGHEPWQLQMFFSVFIKNVFCKQQESCLLVLKHRDNLMQQKNTPRPRSVFTIRNIAIPYTILMSASTPDGRFRFVNASISCGVGLMISMRRLWTRTSNCSRASL